MKKKNNTWIFIILLVIAIGTTAYFYSKEQCKTASIFSSYCKVITPHRIITVGIIPDSGQGETWLSFEKNKNVTVDRFMSYFQMKYHDGSTPRLKKFLYNESLNHIPEVAMEFGTNENATWPAIDYTPLKNILVGNYDTQLILWRDILKNYTDKYDKIVYVRIMPEMLANSNNVWWICSPSNNESDFVPAYRYVVDKLRSTGNKNLRFQLNIGAEGDWGRKTYCDKMTHVNTTYATYEKYYPGDAYVDEWSIDTYNFYFWVKWTSFHDLVKPHYDMMRSIANKPVSIGETNSGNIGGNKTQWILDTFKSVICDFPEMTNIDFFEDGYGAPIWSNPEEIAAFRKGVEMIHKYNIDNGNKGVCK